MSTQVLVYLIIRVIHVVMAAAWFGAATFTTFFLAGAVRDAGPGAGPFMAALDKQKVHVYISSFAGLTVLSGFWLYYRFTGGFDPQLSGSHGARVFGAGGIAGLLALILGGAIVGRTAKKMTETARQAQGTPDGPQKAAMMQTVAALRNRLALWSSVVYVLLLIAIVCMALGHYV